MLLKRHHVIPEGWVPELDDEGNLANPLPSNTPLTHIELIHTGTKREQNFSTSLVLGAVEEGWAELSSTRLSLMVKPETLIYRIKRSPGHYCSHCGTKLGDEFSARAHVAAKHAEAKSPDKQNPAGYCRLNHYECVLDETQHERHRVRLPHELIRKGA